MNLAGWERKYVLWGAIPVLTVFLVPTLLLVLAYAFGPLPATSQALENAGTSAALFGFFVGIYGIPLYLLVGSIVAATQRKGRGVLMFLLGGVLIAGALGALLFGTCAYLLDRSGGLF